jgi:hypothetical protein
VLEWSIENPMAENGRLLYPRFAGWHADGSVRLCVADDTGGGGETPALLRRGADGWRVERVGRAGR